jgi:hypothetical protein
MYQGSESFNEKAKQNGRTSRAKLKIGDTEITTGIRKIVHTSGSCGADSFAIGSVFSAYVDVEIANIGLRIQGKTVEVYFGYLMDDGTIEYAKKGTFIAPKPEGDTQTVTFTAKDNIVMKCSGLYVSNLTYPTTIKDILDEISTQTGVPYRLNGVSAAGQITVKPDGYLHRDVLGYMAGCLGGFVYCDADGTIVISSFDASATSEVTPNLCWSEPTIAENQYKIGGLTVVVSESVDKEETVTKTDEDGETYEDTETVTVEGVSYTYGSGGIEVSNPFMTQPLFDAIKEKVASYSYRPGTVEFLGDARIEPTDVVNVTNLSGESYTIPCMNIVQEFDGGLVTTVSAPSETTSEGTDVKGPLQQTLDRLVTDLTVTKEMVAKRITADEAYLVFTKTDELDATIAEIGYLKTDELESAVGKFGYVKTTELESEVGKFGYVKTTELESEVGKFGYVKTTELESAVGEFGYVKTTELESAVGEFGYVKTTELESAVGEFGYMKSNFSNVEIEDVGLLFGNIGILDNVTIKDGSVTGELKGVKIAGDLIETNTLAVKNLILEGEDGLIYQINALASGLSQTELTDEQYQSKLSGLDLVAKSVTTTQLDVDQIFGNEAVLKKIISSKVLSEFVETNEMVVGSSNKAKEALEKASKAVVKVETLYAISDDESPPESGWSVESPAWEEGKYTWQKTVTTYADQSTEESDPTRITGSKGEDAINLIVRSSRGIAFKNNSISTILTVSIFKGDKIIESSSELHEVFGATAYLEWSWRGLNDDTYGTISADDKRLSADGFIFELSPDDVDTQITINCNLIT